MLTCVRIARAEVLSPPHISVPCGVRRVLNTMSAVLCVHEGVLEWEGVLWGRAVCVYL